MNTIQIASPVVGPEKHTFHDAIPVIDMKDLYSSTSRTRFIESLRAAFQTIGFVAIVNAELDMQVLDEAYKTAGDFFKQPLEVKREIKSSTNSGERGYVDTESPKGQGEKVSDFKEFLHMGREHSLGLPKNIWPKSCNLKDEMNRLYSNLETLVEPLSEAIAEAASIPLSLIREMTHEGDHLLRAVHYPKNPPPGEFWAAEHTDINLFTLLPKATKEGLQVQLADGRWIDAEVPDGALLVNVGDMLQNLTNGLFRSSVHRVVCKTPDVDRYSLVLFAHAHPSDRMDPISSCIERTGGKRKYPNASRQELLEQRIVEMGRASLEMMQSLAKSGLIEQEIQLGLDCSKVRSILRDCDESIFPSETVKVIFLRSLTTKGIVT